MKVVSFLLMTMMMMMINSRSHDGTSRVVRRQDSVIRFDSTTDAFEAFERIGEGSFNFKLTSLNVRRRRDARARTFLKMLPLADFLLLMGVFFPLLGVSVAYICRFATTRSSAERAHTGVMCFCSSAFGSWSVSLSCRRDVCRMIREYLLLIDREKPLVFPKLPAQNEQSRLFLFPHFYKNAPQNPKQNSFRHSQLWWSALCLFPIATPRWMTHTPPSSSSRSSYVTTIKKNTPCLISFWSKKPCMFRKAVPAVNDQQEKKNPLVPVSTSVSLSHQQSRLGHYFTESPSGTDSRRWQ